jgi:uncharacterized LabA/DUF88 family protein
MGQELVMRRIANFIDAAYLEQLTRELSGPSSDFHALADRMSGKCDVLRSYYYDCLPYLGGNPSTENRNRHARKQGFLTALSHLPRFTVRLGKLEFRGRYDNGRSIYQQKRVDVSLGVDLAVLATKHLITDAAFLAGDSDFVPAIEAAKAEGVVVHLFHGEDAHDDLIRLCDERSVIDYEFVNSIARRDVALACA